MAVAHGQSSISVDGDIITVKAVGAFNLEGITKTIEQLKLFIEGFGQKEFKLLFDYTEIDGGTPDVFDKINECNIWLNSQNMVAKAVVINSSILLAILESRTPARNSQNAQSFDDTTSAINWLASQ
ncbi:MAG: hypothetical protein HRT50_01255 [Colwellia sp.]|uniref:hypothetical protein n=1 Tax=Colwellia sp. TaxID=56799 RepID=UPI001D3C76F7|nr:hypothetical protein [Colwellia sp.]NQY47730.1 hypothetical protein [Colwellia sp.]